MSQTKAQLIDGKSAEIEFTGGSASGPAISFTGDSNTGIYSPGADQVAVATNGTARLYIASDGKVGVGTTSPGSILDVKPSASSSTVRIEAGTINTDSIRIQSGGTANTYLEYRGYLGHAWFVDTTERARIDSSGRLGIGTSAPWTNSEIRGTNVADGVASRTFGTPPSNLHIGVNGYAQNTGGSISFGSDADNTANYCAYGAIAARRDSALGYEYSGYLTFSTSSGSNLNEKMRLTSAGRLGIGTTSPAYQLTLSSNPSFWEAGFDTVIAGGDQTLKIISDAFGGGGRTGNIAFYVNGASNEAARIDSSGRLLVGTSSTFDQSARLQVIADTGTSVAANFYSYGADNSQFVIGAARGTVASPTTLNSNDTIGGVYFRGHDGTSFKTGAQILAQIDDITPGSDLPSRLVFSTTADGASAPTERMRIGSGGQMWINQTSNISGAGNSVLLQATATGPDYTCAFANSNASPYGIYVRYSTDVNTTSNSFVFCQGLGVTRVDLRSNGGIANYQANNVNLSDINTKKNISPAAATWDCIKEWEIVNYRYKDQPDDADLNLGVIAQQVAESCPEVITVFQEAKEATEDAPAQEERLGVKEQQMYWMAIKALQEAQVRIEALEAEVAALKAS